MAANSSNCSKSGVPNSTIRTIATLSSPAQSSLSSSSSSSSSASASTVSSSNMCLQIPIKVYWGRQTRRFLFPWQTKNPNSPRAFRQTPTSSSIVSASQSSLLAQLHNKISTLINVDSQAFQVYLSRKSLQSSDPAYPSLTTLTSPSGSSTESDGLEELIDSDEKLLTQLSTFYRIGGLDEEKRKCIRLAVRRKREKHSITATETCGQPLSHTQLQEEKCAPMPIVPSVIAVEAARSSFSSSSSSVSSSRPKRRISRGVSEPDFVHEKTTLDEERNSSISSARLRRHSSDLFSSSTSVSPSSISRAVYSTHQSLHLAARQLLSANQSLCTAVGGKEEQNELEGAMIEIAKTVILMKGEAKKLERMLKDMRKKKNLGNIEVGKLSMPLEQTEKGSNSRISSSGAVDGKKEIDGEFEEQKSSLNAKDGRRERSASSVVPYSASKPDDTKVCGVCSSTVCICPQSTTAPASTNDASTAIQAPAAAPFVESCGSSSSASSAFPCSSPSISGSVCSSRFIDLMSDCDEWSAEHTTLSSLGYHNRHFNSVLLTLHQGNVEKVIQDLKTFHKVKV